MTNKLKETLNYIKDIQGQIEQVVNARYPTGIEVHLTGYTETDINTIITLCQNIALAQQIDEEEMKNIFAYLAKFNTYPEILKEYQQIFGIIYIYSKQ